MIHHKAITTNIHGTLVSDMPPKIISSWATDHREDLALSQSDTVSVLMMLVSLESTRELNQTILLLFPCFTCFTKITMPNTFVSLSFSIFQNFIDSKLADTQNISY